MAKTENQSSFPVVSSVMVASVVLSFLTLAGLGIASLFAPTWFQELRIRFASKVAQEDVSSALANANRLKEVETKLRLANERLADQDANLERLKFDLATTVQRLDDANEAIQEETRVSSPVSPIPITEYAGLIENFVDS